MYTSDDDCVRTRVEEGSPVQSCYWFHCGRSGACNVSRKGLLLFTIQFSRGMASGLSSLLHDDQFSFQRRARINRNSEQRFARSQISGVAFP